MKWFIALFMGVLTLAVVGCSGQPKSAPSSTAAQAKVQNLTTADVQKRLESGDNYVVLDVREDYEFKEGHIPGAKLIPLGSLEKRLGELKKDDQIIVVCRSGNRSAQGADLLVQSGFTKVFNMAGGMNQWKGKVEK